MNTTILDTKVVLAVHDVAEVLGVSVWFVYSEICKVKRSGKPSDKIPPFFYIGRLPKFYAEDILKWLETRERMGTKG